MQSTWRRAARAHLIGSGLATALMLAAGMAAPSMAQEGFSEDLGIIKACGSDIWSSLLGRAARCRTRQELCTEQDGPAFQRLPR